MYVTRPMTMQGSVFVGMAVPVSRLDDVRLAYIKARDRQPYVDHIMAGYSAAGLQGSCNHGEHFGGLEILKTLKQQDRKDLAVFVSRIYGGVHLGSKRFRIIKNLTKELFQIMDQGSRVDASVDVSWRESFSTPDNTTQSEVEDDIETDAWSVGSGPREEWSNTEVETATVNNDDQALVEEAMDT